MSLQFTAAPRACLLVLFVFYASPSAAVDGTIRIRGAIVEPACTVSTSAFGISNDQLPSARQPRSSSAMPLELSMRCNAQQAISVTLLQPQAKTRAGFDTGIEGVHMQLQHKGQMVSPGQAMSVSLPQRATHQIRMETHLERDASARARQASMPDAMPPSSKMKDGARLLVAIDYM
jgi:type 1 fimbria pilin